ncbi:MAG: HAMP domain-containing histidine kinase, partial [Flavobacteriales bacterium]|nr:HAMP domain-containing histidine kinase [Flavobacteriales bacterium]
MTKRILYTIIIGMGVSLLGIIWVQLYWIDNARTVKEAQFDHHVSLALNTSVESLDQREQVFFLKRQITSPEGGRIVRTQVANNGETVEDVTKWVIQCVGKDGHVLAECNDTGTCILTHANDQKVRREQVHRSRRVRVVAGSDSLQEERNIEMVVRASEDDTLQFNQVMGKMVREFRRRSDPLKSKLAGINLQKVLATDLKNHGIDLPFEYAVVNRDHIVEEYSSAGFAIEELESCYRIDLFKGDIVNHPGELVLLFSGKHSWVFSKMWFMLMASLLFTGIIVLTFACTVYYLIKQKKLADIKNDFIDNMTHEFKTPISTISLALDSITHPKVRGNTERVEQYAEIIRQENRRMNSQVESVLNTALAERRELNLDEKEIDIHQIINKLCDRMQLSFQ